MASLWRRFRGLSMWVQAVVAVFVVTVVIAAATGGEDDEAPPAPPTTVESDGPGSQAVYDRINSTTDCAELQDEFDTAMTNAENRPAGERAVPMSYAEAADERMATLGCYD